MHITLLSADCVRYLGVGRQRERFRDESYVAAQSPLTDTTTSFSTAQTWGYDEARDLPGIEETWNLLNGKDLGFYDSAEVYGSGLSERIIGKQLAKTPAEQRSKVILATKVSGISSVWHKYRRFKLTVRARSGVFASRASCLATQGCPG